MVKVKNFSEPRLIIKFFDNNALIFMSVTGDAFEVEGEYDPAAEWLD